jgi:hypothetical protein
MVAVEAVVCRIVLILSPVSPLVTVNWGQAKHQCFRPCPRCPHRPQLKVRAENARGHGLRSLLVSRLYIALHAERVRPMREAISAYSQPSATIFSNVSLSAWLQQYSARVFGGR